MGRSPDFSWVLLGIGLEGGKPDIGFTGELYYATDTEILYRGTGSDWTAMTWAGGYTELDGSINTTAAAQGAGDGAWVTWDLSETLPVGTIVVDIMIHKIGAPDYVGCRKGGSALIRKFHAVKNEQVLVPVEVETDRIIEIMSDDVSDADTFSVVGYWS